MRIDSASFFSAGLAGITNNQSAMARLNQQIATGQALLAPKDDPMAMTQILALTDQVAVRTQYSTNQTKADISLKFESTVLSAVQTTLNTIRGLLVGVSPSSDAQTRTNTAQQLSALFNQLQGMANTRDSAGNYIFAGAKTNLPTTTPPFANTGGTQIVPTPATVYSGVATNYNGDATTRSVQIDVGRNIQVSDNLNSVFQSGVPGSDLLQTLDQAINTLPVNTPGNPNMITSQSTLDGYVAVIDQALGNLSTIQYRVAGAHTELANVKQTTQTLLTNDQGALSDVSMVDKATAITELQARQTTLDAASKAYSLTSSMSLFKYM